MLSKNHAFVDRVASPPPPYPFQVASVLGMMWQCDACHSGNICDVSSETHFFAILLAAKSNHASVSPFCEWDPTKIHGCLFHSQ